MIFFKFLDRSRRIYLDYASSTPLDRHMYATIPQVPKNVASANPSALHKEGVALKGYLNRARARVTKVLEVQSDEIIFTASATESDNLALRGVTRSFLNSGIAPQEIVVVTSELEHSAVSETVAHLIKKGMQYIVLPVLDGVINPKDIVVPENVKAVIISIMYSNNEIGTVQPIEDIAKRVRKLRKEYP